MFGARRFFNSEEQDLLVKAIETAELSTSGEIRLHLENYCFGSEVKAAQKIFTKLKMHQTAERNGVLIYIAVQSRKIAVVGDQGIHQKLGQTYWETLVQQLISGFKLNRKADSLAACIIELGTQLSSNFPRQTNDTNELKNDISF